MSNDSKKSLPWTLVADDFKKYGTWCPDIYRGLYIDRWNDNEVRVAPCCQADTKTEPVDKFTFATSPYLNSLREKFDRGERPTECKRCWDYEDLNVGTEYRSRRQKAIITHENAKEKFEPDRSVMLSSLDYCCTWICNLACAICRPLNSSLWSAELKQTKEERKKVGRLYELKPQPSLSDQLEFNEVYRVHFNGGEPLATKEHIKVLEKLANQGLLKDAIISYNTNGTMYPSTAVVDLWKQAKTVHVSFSIDGIGPAFEYIRWPAKWDQVSSNMLKMKQEMPTNVEFGFTVAIGALNVFDLLDLWNWYTNNIEPGIAWDRTKFSWQFITEMDIGTLRDDLKLTAIEILKDTPMFGGIREYIQNTLDDKNIVTKNPHSFMYPIWNEQLDTIDARRGTDWKTALSVGKYY